MFFKKTSPAEKISAGEFHSIVPQAEEFCERRLFYDFIKPLSYSAASNSSVIR